MIDDTIDRLAAAPRRDLPQTLQALFGKPLTPQRDRVAIDADRRGDAQIGSAFGGRRYDPATQCDLLGSPVCGEPLLKLLTLRGGEGQGPAGIRHTISIVDTDMPIQLFAGHYTSSSDRCLPVGCTRGRAANHRCQAHNSIRVVIRRQTIRMQQAVPSRSRQLGEPGDKLHIAAAFAMFQLVEYRQLVDANVSHSADSRRLSVIPAWLNGRPHKNIFHHPSLSFLPPL